MFGAVNKFQFVYIVLVVVAVMTVLDFGIRAYSMRSSLLSGKPSVALIVLLVVQLLVVGITIYVATIMADWKVCREPIAIAEKSETSTSEVVASESSGDDDLVAAPF